MKPVKARFLNVCKKTVVFLSVQMLLLVVTTLHIEQRYRHFQFDVTYHGAQAARVPEKRREYGPIKRKISRTAMTNAAINQLVIQSGFKIYRDNLNPRFSTLVLAAPP